MKNYEKLLETCKDNHLPLEAGLFTHLSYDRLADVYGTCSYEKQQAESRILDEMESMNGHGYSITSHNCNFFSCCYWVDFDDIEAQVNHTPFSKSLCLSWNDLIELKVVYHSKYDNKKRWCKILYPNTTEYNELYVINQCGLQKSRYDIVSIHEITLVK